MEERNQMRLTGATEPKHIRLKDAIPSMHIRLAGIIA
jgi:hypothetical protein